MSIQYPNYRQSIVSVACSILRHYGADYIHNSLSEVDELLQKNYDNVVLMVFDGLGVDALKKHLGPKTFLRKHLKKNLSSVFPPTTTAATTSITSGLQPIEHAWLGWRMYFKEEDQILELFTNQMVHKAIPFESIASQIKKVKKRPCYTVSPFGNYPIDCLDGLCDAVKTLTEESGEKYIYTYWNEPDFTMHGNGCYSRITELVIKDINQKVQKMCKGLKNTLVLITADHGLIDAEPYCLLDYPEIVETLERMPSIEPRALAFYIKKGKEETFKKHFTEAFGKSFLLFSKEDVLKNHLFGDGVQHPRFKDFIGDYLAVAISPKTLFRTYEECKRFKGAHGGMTPKEMWVPLIAIECK